MLIPMITDDESVVKLKAIAKNLTLIGADENGNSPLSSVLCNLVLLNLMLIDSFAQAIHEDKGDDIEFSRQKLFEAISYNIKRIL